VKRYNNTDASVIRRGRQTLRFVLHRLVTFASCGAILIGTSPEPVHAQAPPATQQVDAQDYNVEQLDALLAPIALYPDQLLTQILMVLSQSGFSVTSYKV